MSSGLNILIVEDEFITQETLRSLLTELGYGISGDAMNADEAIAVLEKKQTDLAILDVQIQGDKDGIWVAQQIHYKYQIPFIFLTSNSDKRTVNSAAETQPYGYLVKPFNKADIFAAIEIALKNYSSANSKRIVDNDAHLSTNDHLFIKENNLFIKITKSDIIYIKTEGHYLEVFSKSKKHLVRGNAKDFLNLLGSHQFIQVHRSYIVNIKEIESFGGNFIMINKTEIPLSSSFKDDFMKRITTF